MKRLQTLSCILTLLAIGAASALAQTTITVDPKANPETPILKRSIMGAVNVAQHGDKVKVLPGTYYEKVVIDKDITVEGSGAEGTIINWVQVGNAVEISTGKLKWLRITSGGDGILASGDAIITNCVIEGCQGNGVSMKENAVLLNTIIMNNTKYGVWIERNANVSIVNIIAVSNLDYGIRSESNRNLGYCAAYKNDGRSDGSYQVSGISETVNCIFEDPKLIPGQYNISPSSKCYRIGGHPSFPDPDNQGSSMGYYGGPEAPTFPVIIVATPDLNGDGTITIKAKAVSRY